MHFQNALYGALLLASGAQAGVSQLSMIAHESLVEIPGGWKLAHKPEPSTRMTLQVALPLQNLDKMEKQLYAVSTPDHPSYGQHLDRDEVNAMVAPSPASESAVKAWLSTLGITKMTSDGHVVTFVTDVETANKLLDTDFQYYEHSGVKKLRTTHYKIPSALANDIDFISPTVMFGMPKAPKFVASTTTKRDEITPRKPAPPCFTSLTPACLKEIYKIKYTPTGNTISSLGFGSFLNQSSRNKDLKLYEKLNGIPLQKVPKIFVNDAKNNQSAASPDFGEANLDAQNQIGISHPLPCREYLTGGSPPFLPDPTEPTQNFNEPYLPYYQFLLSQSNSDLPQVLSNSYGEDEQTVPKKYAIRVCNLIGMMGLRGITIFESSGDEGVGAGCRSTDGKNTPQFNPIFPATCPYLTAVGGTVSVAPQKAWVGSSGGFSYYFSRPTYQAEVVDAYLDRFIPKKVLKYYQPYFDQNGRGFPDVSAISVDPDYQVYYGNKISRSGGTSAAAPVLAGIAAIINENLLAAGKRQLGFLNPFLYSKGIEGLTDITLGGSIGCNGNNTQTGQPVPGAGIIPYASWNATAGWDPATGLGVPRTQKLIEIALSG